MMTVSAADGFIGEHDGIARRVGVAAARETRLVPELSA